MKVLMTGATGLVGTALTQGLVRDGHTVCRMVRRETVSRKSGSPAQSAGPRVIDVPWDPEASDGLTFADSQGDIAGADAVVNLAGASIAEGRWTQQGKMVLRSSRVRTTRALVSALGRLKRVPKVLVSASAIGYYGGPRRRNADRRQQSRGQFPGEGRDGLGSGGEKGGSVGDAGRADAVRSHPGKAWRRAAAMMRPFRFFVGGKRARAAMGSWITLDDVIGVIRYALENASVSRRYKCGGAETGPQCGVHARTGAGDAPARMFPAPAFALRLALGARWRIRCCWRASAWNRRGCGSSHTIFS